MCDGPCNAIERLIDRYTYPVAIDRIKAMVNLYLHFQSHWFYKYKCDNNIECDNKEHIDMLIKDALIQILMLQINSIQPYRCNYLTFKSCLISQLGSSDESWLYDYGTFLIYVCEMLPKRLQCDERYVEENVTDIEDLLTRLFCIQTNSKAKQILNYRSTKFKRETTALHALCKKIEKLTDIMINIDKYLNTLDLMIGLGADINIHDAKGNTPLFYVKNAKVIELFIKNGCLVRPVDNSLSTKLRLLENYLKSIVWSDQSLIDLIVCKDNDGNNMFIQACQTGNQSTVLKIHNYVTKRCRKGKKSIIDEIVNNQTNNGYILACKCYNGWNQDYKNWHDAIDFFSVLIDMCKVNITISDENSHYGSHWIPKTSKKLKKYLQQKESLAIGHKKKRQRKR